MLSLPVTPIIYYGVEFLKLNDDEYYKEMIQLSGKDDTRFLVRGKVDWKEVDQDLKDKNSFSSNVYKHVKNLINTRNKYKCFGRGSLEWIDMLNNEGNKLSEVLAYVRVHQNEKILVINNLSGKSIAVMGNLIKTTLNKDIFGNMIKIEKELLLLQPFQYLWINENK